MNEVDYSKIKINVTFYTRAYKNEYCSFLQQIYSSDKTYIVENPYGTKRFNQFYVELLAHIFERYPYIPGYQKDVCDSSAIINYILYENSDSVCLDMSVFVCDNVYKENYQNEFLNVIKSYSNKHVTVKKFVVIFDSYDDFDNYKSLKKSVFEIPSENIKNDIKMFECLVYKYFEHYEGRGPLPLNQFYTAPGHTHVENNAYTFLMEVYEGRQTYNILEIIQTVIIQDFLTMREMYSKLKDSEDYNTLIFFTDFLKNQVIRKRDDTYHVFFRMKDALTLVKRFTHICAAINEYDESFMFTFSTVPDFVVTDVKRGPLRSFDIEHLQPFKHEVIENDDEGEEDDV